MAGRGTLIQSVLEALPTYTMQTTRLPMSICDVLEKKSRDFLWGHTEKVNKLHLVGWRKVCQPKSMGGLGFRLLRKQNEAFFT